MWPAPWKRTQPRGGPPCCLPASGGETGPARLQLQTYLTVIVTSGDGCYNCEHPPLPELRHFLVSERVSLDRWVLRIPPSETTAGCGPILPVLSRSRSCPGGAPLACCPGKVSEVEGPGLGPWQPRHVEGLLWASVPTSAPTSQCYPEFATGPGQRYMAEKRQFWEAKLRRVGTLLGSRRGLLSSVKILKIYLDLSAISSRFLLRIPIF